MSVSIKEIIERELQQEEIPLPTIDNTAASIMNLLQNENTSIDDLASVIERDPSLTAKVLNLSNSSFYAGLAKIKNVERAISRVGMGTIKNFLMTSSMKNSFEGDIPGLKESFQINWRHSLGCAICAKRIAEHINLRSISEDAYLLGLLHDIGTISIFNTLHKYRSEMDQGLSDELVREITLAFHAQASGQILEKLNFDEKLCKIVAFHQQPDEFPDQDDPLFNILQISNSLLDKLGISLYPDPTITLTGLPYTKTLGLDAMFFAVAEVDIEDALMNLDQMV